MDLKKFERRSSMKKLITLVITLALIASLFVLPSAALTDTEVAALKYTVIMQSGNGMSYTGDDVLFYGKYQMRGMAISQDGKYAFGGYLNPNGSSAIEMSEIATGKAVAGFQFIQPENSKSSYPKGLATDDRGYLYAALAYNPNNTRADLATFTYSDGKITQVGYGNVIMTNEATKTGVNGITVEKVNGTYYAYVVVNYDVDYLVRLNVNDPANPVIDTSFGNNGMIDLKQEPYSVNDANYLDVDTDGTIYLACNTSSEKKVIVLSSDGSMIMNQVVHDTAYGVALWDNYLLITTQNTGKVGIYDKTLLTPVANIEVTMDNIQLPIDRDDILINGGVNSFCNVTVVDDVLFLGDQGSGASGLDQIFAAGLTAEAAAKVASWSKGIHDRLAVAYPEKTEAPETTAAPETEPVTEVPETEPETEPATEAPVQTDASATNAPTTEAPKAEDGCGGMISGAAVLVALLGAAVVFKKKD